MAPYDNIDDKGRSLGYVGISESRGFVHMIREKRDDKFNKNTYAKYPCCIWAR